MYPSYHGGIVEDGKDSSEIVGAASYNLRLSPDLPKILHALANKLLPIVAFSDLGIRSSQDPLALNYFEKIRRATAKICCKCQAT